MEGELLFHLTGQAELKKEQGEFSLNSNVKPKLVFKNFPLSKHKFAMKAAAAALAANKQGKFWEFHDRLFKNYKNLNDTKIQEIAKELALDMERFNKDLKDNDGFTCKNSGTSS
ncbi:MAG: thioredoxin domain-containing protein [Desulfobacteraceae bacterium]|nr:thioredoxin domain-containing protein [Desulfobacteraceae bacterium]